MTSVRTVISGGAVSPSLNGDEAAAAIEGFEGVALDPQAQAEIAAALEACAARAQADYAAREQGGMAAGDADEDDPEVTFVRATSDVDYRGTLEPPETCEEFVAFTPGEDPWRLAGQEMPAHWAEWLEAQEAKAAAAGGEAPAVEREEIAPVSPGRRRRGRG